MDETTGSNSLNIPDNGVCSVEGRTNFERHQKRILRGIRHNSRWFECVFWSLIAVGLSTHLGISINVSLEDSIPLLVFAALFCVLTIFYIIKHRHGTQIVKFYDERLRHGLERFWRVGRWVWYCMMAVGMIVFLIMDVGRHRPRHLVSLCGMAFFIITCSVLSKAPSKIPWRTVYCGMVVQFVFGLAVLRWQAGSNAIDWLSNQIVTFVNYGLAGARFMFGDSFEEHGFAMTLVPIITWFTAVTNILLYLNIIQFISRVVGGLLYFVIGSSTVEAFVAVCSIFLGPEAPVVMIRSVIHTLTPSQLHSILSCGLASIDAGLLPIFVSFGIPASHLLSASCMSAPAALVISKILYPETRKKDLGKLKLTKPEGSNPIALFLKGARDSILLSANIVAVLLAVVSILACVNGTIAWFGDRAGVQELTLQKIISYILMPVVYLMGVAWEDCGHVGQLIGTKTILNEFVAYLNLAELVNNRIEGLEPSISERSEIIAAYALCGFSNFATVGIQVGFMIALLPEKKDVITGMAWSSLVAGSVACMMTACMAGLLVA